MSGHSKWAKIKRAKGANDAKRGALFTKLGRNITVAASEGGGDPDMNFALRLAVDKAKAANMPSDNIERAIKKGTGEGEKVQITRISYEALGPGGTGIIIDCQTDNTNRTVAEVRKLVESAGGKMVAVGSVSWQFEEKGLITVIPAKVKKAEKYGAEDTWEQVDLEEAQLELLETEGIEDMSESSAEDDDGNTYRVLEVLTDKTDFASVLKSIEEQTFRVESAELVKVAKEQVALSDEDRKRLDAVVESLDDHDDVDSVWTNAA
ncbi:MAG: putative transcriptional regulatory protein [candidate division WS6 bacterium OLB20]|uniref:Probable transcriptional regulatory protein TR69_WS6001000610 n=1 Tax=candidate division WS6 bacterium OLB20 TaxID=1617426 RepID=A0A136LY59_9BACT|nr:MAG: putative transcriptional regulatory protein [candidate division WS6 bacterium OLB20]